MPADELFLVTNKTSIFNLQFQKMFWGHCFQAPIWEVVQPLPKAHPFDMDDLFSVTF